MALAQRLQVRPIKERGSFATMGFNVVNDDRALGTAV
jgi:hypothetical protein